MPQRGSLLVCRQLCWYTEGKMAALTGCNIIQHGTNLEPSSLVSVAKYSKTLSGPLRSRIRFSYLKKVLCRVDRGKICHDCSKSRQLIAFCNKPSALSLTRCYAVPYLCFRVYSSYIFRPGCANAACYSQTSCCWPKVCV